MTTNEIEEIIEKLRKEFVYIPNVQSGSWRFLTETEASALFSVLRSKLLAYGEKCREETARAIIKDIRNKRKSYKEKYGRDAHWEYEGVKKMYGLVKTVLDKYEPKIDKINRDKSRIGRKKYFESFKTKKL